MRKGRILGVIFSDCDFKYKVMWVKYIWIRLILDSIDIDMIFGNYLKVG